MDKQLIVDLALARIQYESAKKARKSLEEKMRQSSDFLAASKKEEDAVVAEMKAEEALRAAALAEFKVEKNKRTDSYEIKDDTTYKIVNPANAQAWCKKNLPSAFKFDQAALINAAKGKVDNVVVPSTLVKVETTDKVYLKSDLSAFLPKTEKADDTDIPF